MTVRAPLSVDEFQDPLSRTIYEHVERRGAVTMDDLVRDVRVDDGPPQSKPARLRTYDRRVPVSPERIHEAVETLEGAGYLAQEGGAIRVALSVSPIEYGLESGTIRLRLAHEEDREGLLQTMRAVARDGPYVVGEDVAERVAREPALVRRNDERSRAFFVAVREPTLDEAESRQADGTPAGNGGASDGTIEDEQGNASDGVTDAASATGTNGTTGTAARDDATTESDEVLGWLHAEAPELPSLRHTVALTVGVHPDRRRDGIGSELLEYGLEWVGTVGCRKACQRVPATNKGAVAFLEANDWRREGVREEHYRIDGEFVDEILFATWLEA